LRKLGLTELKGHSKELLSVNNAPKENEKNLVRNLKSLA